MHSKNSTKKAKKAKKENKANNSNKAKKDNSRKVISAKLDKLMNTWRKKEWIGEYLTNKDMAHLRQTNKKAKTVINNHNEFKRKLYLKKLINDLIEKKQNLNPISTGLERQRPRASYRNMYHSDLGLEEQTYRNVTNSQMRGRRLSYI